MKQPRWMQQAKEENYTGLMSAPFHTADP
uniref:Uncharacterized protein n=1 Tax=Rhizophora mucronata TaxID=61149 RepID=A0A2P2NS12_RHIMU